MPSLPDSAWPPRLIYYSDAHHFHAKRIDPPLSLHKMRWPIDELSGTGVDLLAFGLGFGDVYFHQTRIGRVIGQEQEVWDEFINWRIMRMVRDAAALGTDQLREVIRHGREAGVGVFPSLKLQDPTPQGGQRCGWLKWRRGMEVTLGAADDRFPNHQTEWCYDYANAEVREEKLSLIREVLEDYEADGIELDFMFFPLYFRRSDTEAHIPTMNRFVADVRALTREIGERQSRTIPVMARVWHRREENLGIGLDVEAWIAAGHVDLVVGQIPNMLLDPGDTEGRWLADAAKAAGAASYLRPGRRVEDPAGLDRQHRDVPRLRPDPAVAGVHRGLPRLPPLALRGCGVPHSARARLPRGRPCATTSATSCRRGRSCPPTSGPMAAGCRWSSRRAPPRPSPITVADEIEAAAADGEIRDPVLTLTFQQFCVEDDVAIRFNGRELAVDAKGIHEPRRGLYWLRWTLDAGQVVQGENRLELEILRKERTAGFARTLTGVEIHMRYTEFDRPEALDPVKIPPPS